MLANVKPVSMPKTKHFGKEEKNILALCALYDGHQAAASTFLGLLNMPRHKGTPVLHDWMDFHMACAEGVVKALQALAPAGDAEREERARVLVDFEFKRGTGLVSIAAVAAAAAAGSVCRSVSV